MDGRKVPRHTDLSGKVFGRWKVLSKVPKDHAKYNKHALYLCQCSCGSSLRIVSAISLRSKHSKSCGCLQIEAVSKRPFESLYNRIRTHNPSVGVSLTYKEYLKLTNICFCHYCKAEVNWKSTAYNLDRKDNSLGYSKKNCVVCCGSCNRTKGDRFTYEEFMLIAKVSRRINRMRQGGL
jgi:hypothetical protein